MHKKRRIKICLKISLIGSFILSEKKECVQVNSNLAQNSLVHLYSFSKHPSQECLRAMTSKIVIIWKRLRMAEEMHLASQLVFTNLTAVKTRRSNWTPSVKKTLTAFKCNMWFVTPRGSTTSAGDGRVPLVMAVVAV